MQKNAGMGKMGFRGTLIYYTCITLNPKASNTNKIQSVLFVRLILFIQWVPSTPQARDLDDLHDKSNTFVFYNITHIGQMTI